MKPGSWASYQAARELMDNDPDPEPERRRCRCGAFTSWVPQSRTYLTYVMEDGTQMYDTDYFWTCKRCGREDG